MTTGAPPSTTDPGPDGLPDAPAYDVGGLAAVLPSVARSLGVSGLVPESEAPAAWLELPPAHRAVVVLLDGLGDELLRRRGGHAPFLRGLLRTGRRLQAGFPSTTATAMATFGTGLPPGAHGLVGYEVLVPGEDRTFNELNWEQGPDPRIWQPHATVFERAQARGVEVTRIGPGFFDGSGLTESALRGGTFRAARTLADRVDAALAASRSAPRALTYLYWGDIDKLGHEHGCASWQWGRELENVDAELRRLHAGLPPGTALYVTADHGMIDAPLEERLDVARVPELAAGVRHVAGEPRSLQLHVEPGALDDVLATWRAVLGARAHVVSRDEAGAAGWFGPLADDVAPRIGDVVVAMRGTFAVVDSRIHRQELRSLLGVHGSLTDDEVAVPLLVAEPR